MTRPLTRSYAVANLAEAPLAIRIPAPAERNSKLTPNDNEPEGATGGGESDGNRETQGSSQLANPVKPRRRTKALPQRSLLPARSNRNEHPGLIAKPRAKRSSAEVAEAFERKAMLQRQADELEQKRIETLAEMELEEELEAEEEQQAVVKKLAASNSLDDMEDMEAQFDDQEDKDVMFAVADNDSISEVDNAMGGKTAASRGKPVCQVCKDVEHSN
jgi:hypothetical protein